MLRYLSRGSAPPVDDREEKVSFSCSSLHPQSIWIEAPPPFVIPSAVEGSAVLSTSI
jgi:hypothetical protein